MDNLEAVKKILEAHNLFVLLTYGFGNYDALAGKELKEITQQICHLLEADQQVPKEYKSEIQQAVQAERERIIKILVDDDRIACPHVGDNCDRHSCEDCFREILKEGKSE